MGPITFEFDSTKHPGVGIGVQLTSDPMVLEARMLCGPLGMTAVQCTVGEDNAGAGWSQSAGES
jgi:hypothetical protein